MSANDLVFDRQQTILPYVCAVTTLSHSVVASVMGTSQQRALLFSFNQFLFIDFNVYVLFIVNGD